jgi:hypothetical protein
VWKKLKSLNILYDWRPRGGWRPTVARRPRRRTPDLSSQPIFFVKNLFSFFLFFLRPLHVARAWASWGGVCTSPPFFEAFAPTLGSVKSCKLHGDWRFYFFSNFIFSKFRVHLDLYIYRSDFCFMKN